MKRFVVCLALATACAPAVFAGPKIDPQMRERLTQHFQTAKFAVAVESGISAMPAGESILGPDYFVVKCENGGILSRSKSLMNIGQKASQSLDEGEIFTVDAIKVTDTGLNLKLRTVRELYAGMKDVGKSSTNLKSQYDQFGTEIQFKFDAQYLVPSEENVRFIASAVQGHVKLFPNDREARAFAKGEVGSAAKEGEVPEGASEPVAAPAPEKSLSVEVSQAAVSGVSVESILARYLEALGGEAALRAVTTRSARGTVSMTIEGEKLGESNYEIHEKAPNFRLEIAKGNLTNQTTGCDGTTIWSQDSAEGTVEASGGELARGLFDAAFHPELRMQELFPTLRLEGTTKVEGRVAHRIQATTKDGQTATFYFDAKSGLLVRKDVLRQGGRELLFLKNYRTVGGVQEPHLTEVRQDGGDLKSGLTVEFREIEHNQPLDDAMFKKPADAPKAALAIAKLGLTIDVPADPIVAPRMQDVGDTTMVWGTGPTFAVSVEQEPKPKTLAEEMKDRAETGYTGYELGTTEALPDGWLLSYATGDPGDRTTWVFVQRKIDGKDFKCWGSDWGSDKASAAHKLSAIAAACKSLRK